MTNKEKYKKVFDVLASSEIIALEAENMKIKKQKKPVLAVTAAAVALFGTLTVCAAYSTWHKGLTESLQMSEEQQKTLEENGMAAFHEASSVDAGVTVSAPLSITDNYYTLLSFKVEGYAPEKGLQPGFEGIQVTVDGKDEFSWSGSFYDGVSAGEDGCLEYHMVLANLMERDYFAGKPIHVEFNRLGTFEKAEFIPAVEGTWTLDWTLGGADTSELFEMLQELGDTNCRVKEVQLSPVSFSVTYEFPRRELINEYELEDGTVETVAEYEQAPWVKGVKLKDGTVLDVLPDGPGSSGYADDTSDTYVIRNAFDRVINVDEVDSMIFADGMTEEAEYYIVPLK